MDGGGVVVLAMDGYSKVRAGWNATTTVVVVSHVCKTNNSTLAVIAIALGVIAATNENRESRIILLQVFFFNCIGGYNW